MVWLRDINNTAAARNVSFSSHTSTLIKLVTSRLNSGQWVMWVSDADLVSTLVYTHSLYVTHTILLLMGSC